MTNDATRIQIETRIALTNTEIELAAIGVVVLKNRMPNQSSIIIFGQGQCIDVTDCQSILSLCKGPEKDGGLAGLQAAYDGASGVPSSSSSVAGNGEKAQVLLSPPVHPAALFARRVPCCCCRRAPSHLRVNNALSRFVRLLS